MSALTDLENALAAPTASHKRRTRMTDDIDDVLAAADTIDNRLPVEQPRTNWATVQDRLDDVMRNKINELYGAY